MAAENSLTYSCSEVVVGWGLESLVYSFYRNCPVILTKDLPPHPFEVLQDEEAQLSCHVGENKLELYNFLIFNLSMNGLLPFGGQVAKTEEKEGGLYVVSKNALSCLFVTPVLKKIQPQVHEEKKVVVDWINVRSGLRHEYECIENTSDFAKYILFYPSKRIDGSAASNLKDLAVVSHMADEEILDSNYSQFHVRMKVAEIMKEAGIRGPKNGVGPSGQRYRPLLLENYKREVFPLVISKIEIPPIASTLPVVYL